MSRKYGINPDEFNDDINKIIEELSRILVVVYNEGKRQTREIEGDFVEPIQLQVVCKRWREERVSPSRYKNKDSALQYSPDVDKALQD